MHIGRAKWQIATNRPSTHYEQDFPRPWHALTAFAGQRWITGKAKAIFSGRGARHLQCSAPSQLLASTAIPGASPDKARCCCSSSMPAWHIDRSRALTAIVQRLDATTDAPPGSRQWLRSLVAVIGSSGHYSRCRVEVVPTNQGSASVKSRSSRVEASQFESRASAGHGKLGRLSARRRAVSGYSPLAPTLEKTLTCHPPHPFNLPYTECGTGSHLRHVWVRHRLRRLTHS